MLVSYRWLGQYVDLSEISAVDLAEKITRSGIEVDRIIELNEGISGVLVGHVLECGQHPNADKLNKCLVDIGEEEPVQIICGADNVAAGQKVAVARVGAVLPGDFKIKKAKLRGEESHGMICSLQELGIENKLIQKEYAEGIYVFPEGEDIKVGEDALELLGLNDTIFEFDLTPNRSDALSMIGVAYEVAAILDQDVILPEISYEEIEEKATEYVTIKSESLENNPLYIGKLIKNVKIGPSPLWMQTRLMASGIRPHNNVVDITNYILLEYGQPLHAFDYDRIASKEVVIRQAKAKEKIVTLDKEERSLSEDHLVITNGSEPIALAGVMGGANSEVEDGTTRILLESAYFAGPAVRKASKDHGLRSEASNRFEKGVDPERVSLAAERAAQLISQYAEGEVLSGSAKADHLEIKEQNISISLAKINRVLGTSLSLQEVTEIFRRLQFTTSITGETIIVTVPSRRVDIRIEEDLIEEVARIYGYDLIPTTLPEGRPTGGKLSCYQKKRRLVRSFLEATGCSEAITYSLTSEEKSRHYAFSDKDAVRLSMPMSEDRSHLRLSLVPHLLDAVRYNTARQIADLAFFEIGSVFLPNSENTQPLEEEHLAGALTGKWVNHRWQDEKTEVDFFLVKGILEGLFDKLGLTDQIEYEQAEIDRLHPGRTAKILLNKEEIGFIGQVHPTVEKEMDLSNCFVYELNLRKLLNFNVKSLRYTSIPRYPSINRDIALVVDKTVTAKQLAQVITKAGGAKLVDVKVFDLYEGDRIDEDKKSIAFELTYLDRQQTLTDEEVTEIHNKVLEELEKQVGASLRS